MIFHRFLCVLLTRYNTLGVNAMSVRVLSTLEARSAIDRIRQIVSGDLESQLGRLRATGDTLSRPDVWDGNEAERFRSDLWPSTRSALEQAVGAVEQLRQHIEVINQNIMVAGGNA